MGDVHPGSENSEVFVIDPAAEGPEPSATVMGAWAGMVMSVWRLAEVLYGPCFAPFGGIWVMLDGNGLMMGCADRRDLDAAASGSEPV